MRRHTSGARPALPHYTASLSCSVTISALAYQLNTISLSASNFCKSETENVLLMWW